MKKVGRFSFFDVLIRLGIILLFAFTGINNATGQDKYYDLNIPANKAADALNQLSGQTGIQLLFPYDIVDKRVASKVVGSYTLLEALDLMLKDSGLKGSLSDKGAVTISIDNGFSNLNQETKPMITKRNLLAATMAFLFSSGAQQSVGQETDSSSSSNNSTIEEVVVTGIRGSLQRATDIKRDAKGVVDAISAEDIGKFPDTNLAESLQRITGVSIDRANNEGNQVTVRGFGPTFNLVTLNGRQMPKSSTFADVKVDRSFNFRDISAESVHRVDVHKTTTADTISGGIGATINIMTARPFDLGENQLSVNAKGVMDRSNVTGSDTTPEFSGLYSTKLADDKVGLLFSASIADRDSRHETVKTDGWVRGNGGVYTGIDTSGIDRSLNPEGIFFVPQNFVLNVGDHERKRENAQAVFQFAPNDRLTATLDYTYSRFEENLLEQEASFWFDSNGETLGTADANGTVTNPSHENHRLNFAGIHKYAENVNDSMGLNISWQATDSLAFNLDYHDSTSESQPDGQLGEFLTVLSGREFEVDIGLEFDGNEIPRVIADDSGVSTGSAYAAEALRADVSVGRANDIENNIKQLQLDGIWDNKDSGALRNIKFGLASTEYDFDSDRRFFFFVMPDVDQFEIDSLGVQFESRGGIGTDFSGGNNLWPMRAIYDIPELNRLTFERGFGTEGPVAENNVHEETTAAYVQFDFETEFNGIPVFLNAGVRWEDTDVTGSSLTTLPTGVSYQTSEALPLVFDNNGATLESLSGGYTELLPSLNLRMEFSEDLVGRFSYGRSLGRSDVNALVPETAIFEPRPTGPFIASQGDPNLLPLVSDNLDLSLEWYYDEGSYMSAGYFVKYAENFNGSTTVQRAINGANGQPLTDPSINPRPGCPDPTNTNPACRSQSDDPVIIWDVRTQANLEDAKLSGLEVAVQHMFGDTGFGVLANATFVESDLEFNIYEFSENLALPGLSDSANLVGFYDKNGLQVRIAYNWRDDFLLQKDQFFSPDEPVFVDAYGQVDISASYELTDTVTLFLEGINVTDETSYSRGRFENQIYQASSFGSRYALGLRASF